MATWTNATANNATFTNEAQNSASFSNQTYGLSAPMLSVAGAYYGFGPFTYSGGQQLVAGSAPSFTNETIN